MEFTQSLIHTVLLGTDKRQLEKVDIPADLTEAHRLIEQSSADAAEQFLQLAAVISNYRKCGALPLQQAQAVITKAEAEEKSYAGAAAHQVLKDILAEDSATLVAYWLQVCDHAERVVEPELAPVLLDFALKHKAWRSLVSSCAGNRGAWLSSYNTAWQFTPKESGEETWQRGTGEQRRQALQAVRSQDPAKARAWLQEVWAQENANTKAELLQSMSINVGNEDAAWLESLLTEKSTKVKEAALELLKQIPVSGVVQQYWRLLQHAVVLKKEKGLLGIGSRETLEIKLPDDPDENIFKTGIEKLSNRKEYTDEEFIIFQLMQGVPPAGWQTQLNRTPEEIILLFRKHKTAKKFLPALAGATHRFKDAGWALSLATHSDEFYASLEPLMPPAEWDRYALKHVEHNAEEVMRLALQRPEEWSVALATAFLKRAARNPYGYHRGFWAQHIHQVPVAVIAELEKHMPAEEYLKNMWVATSEYLAKLLTLKLQTLQAFQS